MSEETESLFCTDARLFPLADWNSSDIYVRVLPDKFRTDLFLSISCKHHKRGPNLLMQEPQEEGSTDGQTVPRVFGKKGHTLNYLLTNFTYFLSAIPVPTACFFVSLLAGRCLRKPPLFHWYRYPSNMICEVSQNSGTLGKLAYHIKSHRERISQSTYRNSN